MHKSMLKISLSLLFLSVIIYFGGEHSRGIHEQEKLAFEKKKAQMRAALEAEKKKNPPKVVIPPPKKPEIVLTEDKKFPRISGVASPNPRHVRAGLLFERNSKKLLWGKNINKTVPIASLTKVLTTLVVLDEIERRNDVTLDTKIPISATARNTLYSSFIRKYPYKEVPVRDLLQSALIKSANDSCQLLSEYFGDDDPRRFTAMLNNKARQLKMRNSFFFNSHGLPGKTADLDNKSTMADLVLMVEHVFEKRPEIFKWTSKRSVKLPAGDPRAIFIGNTNPVLPMTGVFGLKTGYTLNAGSCLIYTYKRHGRSYTAIVTGSPNKNERNVFSRALILWSDKAAKHLLP